MALKNEVSQVEEIPGIGRVRVGTAEDSKGNLIEIFEVLEKDEEEEEEEMTAKSFSSEIGITKIDDEQRLVAGWVSVITDEIGNIIVDRQGDRISLDVMQKAMHRYIQDSRAGKAMHSGKRVADLVEMVIVTPEFRKMLGAPEGHTGVWAVFKVKDNSVWSKVKKGELRAFSIGGTGKRRQV